MKTEWSEEKLAQVKSFVRDHANKRTPERKIKNRMLSKKYKMEQDPIFYNPDTDDLIPYDTIPEASAVIFIILLCLGVNVFVSFAVAMSLFGIGNVIYFVWLMKNHVYPQIKHLQESLRKMKEE